IHASRWLPLVGGGADDPVVEQGDAEIAQLLKQAEQAVNRPCCFRRTHVLALTLVPAVNQRAMPLGANLGIELPQRLDVFFRQSLRVRYVPAQSAVELGYPRMRAVHLRQRNDVVKIARDTFR